MPAKIDFDSRREPSQSECVVARHDKCGLRQIHFGRNGLHPSRVGRLIEKTNGRRIARKGTIREGVDLQANDLRHYEAENSCTRSGNYDGQGDI
jgi:hypothetical protein